MSSYPNSPTASAFQLSALRQAVQRELNERAKRIDINRRCSERIVASDRGPMFWLRQCTLTENYQWQAQGRLPKESFPFRPHPQQERDYLDWTMHYILTEKECFIPKTREMMTSWLVVGYIAWMCQFFPATGWLAQSEKDDKAQGLIKYANILYDNQADWMKKLHPLKRGDTGTKHMIEWANGSWFKALPQGERQSASEHPYGYFNDESAHQVAWEATVNVTRPAVKQILCVSSAAASRFGDLCDPSLAI